MSRNNTKQVFMIIAVRFLNKIHIMKIFLLLLTTALLSFSFPNSIISYKNYKSYPPGDTSITHILDGKINEWPAQKFETDIPTEIKYALDNDARNLYIAMTIPDFQIQMKMMRQGMQLYIDLKGKKKQGKGIEFPVKRDRSDDNSGNSFRGQRNEQFGGDEINDQQRKANLRSMRAVMAVNLISMKVFGFSDNEPGEQGLEMPGSANIAFTWDSTDIMHIEYKIPLSFFGNSSSLAQKNISIGWKLNGRDMLSPASTTAHHEGRQRGGGGRGNFGGGSFNNRTTHQDSESIMKDQSFWTKYTIS
jgi:hypothetical protein